MREPRRLDSDAFGCYTRCASQYLGIITACEENAVTTRIKKKNRNTLFARILSIFLALLIVGGSLAALIELL